ncbi:hypothetical protein DTO271D3_3296 [Paecilomyces variotii]|nr:hypothetical protein DTO271D3_3296 [Paecilomyces variotii]
MEIAEQDGDGQQEEIDGISGPVSKQLDELAGEHPSRQQLHGQEMRFVVPELGGFMAEEDESHVTQERRGGQRRQMDGVGAPRLATVTQTPNIGLSPLGDGADPLAVTRSSIARPTPPVSEDAKGRSDEQAQEWLDGPVIG